MCNRWKPRLIAVASALLTSVAAAFPGSGTGAETLKPEDPGFVSQVDLSTFRLIAVQHDGRFKTFDTLARELVHHITGGSKLKRQVGGVVVEQDAAFTYLDLIFRPEAYRSTPLVHVKKLPVRRQLVQAAEAALDENERDRILKDGKISLAFLSSPVVLAKLDELSRDIMRTAKDVDALTDAAQLSDARQLRHQMRIVPPPGTTSLQARWFGLDDLQTPVMAGAMPGRTVGVPGLSEGERTELLSHWTQAQQAWRSGDAAGATSALNAMAAGLTQIAPAVYPIEQKRSLEHWYYRNHKMTWVWWFYMLAVVVLLMAVVYRWPRARVAGLALFGVAFTLHTVATGVRWYLAGRIPNSNMFEAVTAAAWFGAAIAIFFELGPRLTYKAWPWRVAWVLTIGGAVVFVISLLARGVAFNDWQQWGPVPTTSLILHSVGAMLLIAMVATRRFAPHGLPILGASVAAMVALMCGRYMPIALNSDISNRMPVLNDLWLYIHTNMIIASYALIGIAFVTACMYVVGRLLTAPTRALWLSMLIPAAIVPLPALPDIINRLALLLHIPVQLEAPITVMMILSAWAPFLIVIVTYFIASMFRTVFRGAAERARQVWEEPVFERIGEPAPAMAFAGRAPSIPRMAMSLRGGSPGANVGEVAYAVRDERQSGLAHVLDGVTMLLMELSFITLWTGIIMGAVWADHSWGRPWGWDPKEVFALNTWIIFLILVHVRLKVKDKALWTAVLAVIGCSVMLFNWIVVNFFITGLHSYA